MRYLLVLSALGVMSAPGGLVAQRLPAPFPSVSQRPEARAPNPDTIRPPGNPVGTVVGGVLGGTAVFFLGAIVGGNVENRYFPCHCDDPGLRGVLWGAAIGESVGLAIGAHVGNGRRGNLALDLLASAGVGAAGIATIVLAGNNGTGLLLIPVAQLATVALAELAVGRR